jgi:hypothetical protein
MKFLVTFFILLASYGVMRTKIKEVCMNGKLIRQISIFAVSLIVVLALSLASASGGGSQGGGGTGGGSGQSGGSAAQAGSGSGGQAVSLGDTLQTRDRDQLRDQTQDPDQDQTMDRSRDRLRTPDSEHDPKLVYKDSDGKEHEWQKRFNHKLQKCEENDDPEGLTRSLYRIANRYRLSSEGDAEGFVNWAMGHRPWAIEE